VRLRALVFAGIMAGLAAALQTAPVWFGQPVGFILAIFACLPVAVAVVVSQREAALAVLAAGLLCLLISPQEGLIFTFTNGAMGLALGWGARDGWLKSVWVTGVTLWAGMSVLTWGLGIAALGPGLLRLSWPVVFTAYGGFSFVWSALFAAVFRPVYRRLHKKIAATA
jgi:phosphotransferase system  glucose/maltose/N-acetylglucosamine-specific IIC component